MWTLILNFLEELGMALLGPFFQTITKVLQGAGVANADLSMIQTLINQVEADPNYAGNPEAQAFAVKSAVDTYLKDNELKLSQDAVNTVIALATHHAHTTAPAAAATSPASSSSSAAQPQAAATEEPAKAS
jgi:hypothetical protein